MSLLPKKLSSRLSLAIVILLVLIVLIDQVWILAVHNITIDPATTRITGPIVDGYPDYLAALNLQGAKDVTPDNNAAPLIFQILPDTRTPTPWINAVYSVWRLPLPTTGPVFSDYKAWSKTHIPASTRPGASYLNDEAIDDELDNAAKHPWTKDQHPNLARWLNDSAPALALLEQATTRPRYYFPYATQDGLIATPGAVIDIQWHELGPLRALAITLNARAMLRLQHHDLDGFQQDILTTFRLARLQQQQLSLIDQLVAVSIEALAQQSIRTAATANLLDAPHTQSLIQFLQTQPPFPNLAHSIDTTERYMFLDAACSVRRGTSISAITGGSPALGFQALLHIIPVNFNAILRQANGYYDEMIAAFNLPTFSQRRAAMKAFDKKFEAIASAGILHKITHPADILFIILVPSLEKASELCTRCLAEHDLTLTALELYAYQLQTHTFPNTLKDLASPTFTPPLDRYTNAPLLYKKTPAGYLLYSVAENQKDDGGVPRSSRTGENYDLVVQSPPPPASTAP